MAKRCDHLPLFYLWKICNTSEIIGMFWRISSKREYQGRQDIKTEFKPLILDRQHYVIKFQVITMIKIKRIWIPEYCNYKLIRKDVPNKMVEYARLCHTITKTHIKNVYQYVMDDSKRKVVKSW